MATEKNPMSEGQGTFGKLDSRLYQNTSLFNEKDRLLGIKNKHYADIVMSGNDEVSA